MTTTTNKSLKLHHRMSRLFSSITVGATIGLSSLFIVVPAQAEEFDLEVTIAKEGKVTQTQVIYVPFSGDSDITNIILQDLQTTSLNITSQGLFQQPHSSQDLAATLPAWQQLGIPFLVIGRSAFDGGSHLVTFEVIDLNTGRILGQESVRGSNKRTLAHDVSSRIYKLITGNDVSDLNARIAYVLEKKTSKGKNSSLVISDADGENAQILTADNNAIMYRPAASPDGRYIAYSVQRTKQRAGLYVMDTTTRSIRRLVDLKGDNLSPSFSPDGRQVVFSSNVSGTHDLYSVPVSGGTVVRKLALPGEQVQPSYGKDGSIVFASDHENLNTNATRLYRLHPSGALTRLSKGGYAADPSVSPDGDKIGYLNGNSAAVMSTQGANIANFGATGIDEAPSFSPSGERVVYSQGRGNSSLVIRSLEGGKTIVKPVNGTVRSPTWVPSAN